MCACSLSLKTISCIDGVRNIIVNPNQRLSILKDVKNAECKIIYKMRIVIESLTFKEYSMIDGDVIYLIAPKTDTKFNREIEREKLRLMDIRLNSIEGSSRKSQKFICSKMTYLRKLEDSNEDDHSYRILRLMKQDHPSNTPLPRFWVE